MTVWVAGVVRRIRELAAAGRVSLTLKALRELAVLRLDADDAVDVLRGLSSGDAHARLRAVETGEWMYVFKPKVAEVIVYLKVVVRDDCVLVSFHEDEASDDDSA